MTSASEQFILHHLEKNFDCRLRKIPESSAKSPDFECIENGKRIFVVELKNLEHVEASEETGWKVTYHPGGIREAERNNNSVSRIANRIFEGFKQLKQYSEPKGMIFLNRDRRMKIQHLEEAYCGERVYSDGAVAYKNTASKRISEGELKKVKDKIDFFIWVENSSKRCAFRFVTAIGKTILSQHFKMPLN